MPQHPLRLQEYLEHPQFLALLLLQMHFLRLLGLPPRMHSLQLLGLLPQIHSLQPLARHPLLLQAFPRLLALLLPMRVYLQLQVLLLLTLAFPPLRVLLLPMRAFLRLLALLLAMRACLRPLELLRWIRVCLQLLDRLPRPQALLPCHRMPLGYLLLLLSKFKYPFFIKGNLFFHNTNKIIPYLIPSAISLLVANSAKIGRIFADGEFSR
jgi:hypothetical protein